MLSFQYPDVYRDETAVQDYHGHKICDPYAWLEDPDSEQTKAFVEAQNKITVPFLEQCPIRGLYKERMTELYDYPKYSCHFKKGKRYFYFYNTGLQNQRVLYVQDSLEGEARVFLDPNTLSDDGTVALRGYAFSEDGEYFAYGLSASGSDWVTIKFMKVDGAKELPDVLERVKFTCMAWTHDGKGMFYNSYPQQDGRSDGTETSTNLHQKLCYHVLGTDQSEDILCAEFPDEPKWMGGAELSDDGRYVLLSIWEGCDPVNRLWYCDLQQESNGITGILNWVKLIDNFEGEYDYVTNEGTVFTFKTNRNSPNYRLINIDFTDPDESKWKVLVPEHEKDVLEWVACVRSNFLVLCYLHDVKNILQLHDLTTGALLKTFPLDVGSVVGYSGRRKDSEIFYQFTSFLSPGVIYHCDLTKEELEPTVFREVTVKGIDASEYQTIQVFYPSKDGTKIPMFIVHKKGIKLDGSHPAFLYGYGGFNISITPNYSVSRLIFVRHMGGVLAVANIRGGGEYGETWHKGGVFPLQNQESGLTPALVMLIFLSERAGAERTESFLTEREPLQTHCPRHSPVKTALFIWYFPLQSRIMKHRFFQTLWIFFFQQHLRGVVWGGFWYLAPDGLAFQFGIIWLSQKRFQSRPISAKRKRQSCDFPAPRVHPSWLPASRDIMSYLALCWEG